MAYFDCILWKETRTTGKKYAVKIGSAKQRDDGGFFVNLDALPPTGEFVISPQRQQQRSDSGPRDPEVPF